MSVSTPGAGFSDTVPIISNEKDYFDFVQTLNLADNSNNSDSDSLPTSFSEPEIQNKTSVPKTTDLATAIANFRPTPKEIINGIAPHVFDERRTKSRRRRSLNRRGSLGRGRPSSVSYDFYHPGLAGMHGSAGHPTHSGVSRRSSRTFDGAIPRPATAPYYSSSSMKPGLSPLRISAVITVENIDTLLGTESERQQISDHKAKNSEFPQDSLTLPTLGSNVERKSRMPRLELTLGKRKTASDEGTSSSSSLAGDSNKRTSTRKAKWPMIRIDIQVLRSIGSKIM
ncbi:hypothetical protein HHX47_DHR9000136 [Lentinula edodes]|nr:hypothetical protein HHX47_DHR9000136 [Lentinula edodes]